jgi:hypothetical protein
LKVEALTKANKFQVEETSKGDVASPNIQIFHRKRYNGKKGVVVGSPNEGLF